ncbi:MAG: 5-methyltetrahydropteroyltriglutamate--homocysteine S-methyltransferase [Ignavibacteria bacterium]|nr:5-methyltetrahydropteroyltriglutamate--homocysteine S-methyltransferase [Ignavibacteria bacterium]
MLKNNLGMPRIGQNREIKKACEKYWSGQISNDELIAAGKLVRNENYEIQLKENIDLIPCCNFSFYDHVLDMSLTVGNIPERYLKNQELKNSEIDLYFAMARGYQKAGIDIPAMEMTKWFDTNYHYIVPEFTKNQTFQLQSTKIIDEFLEAQDMVGFKAKPCILGPISYLLLGKEKENGFHRIELLNKLMPVYFELLETIYKQGAQWIQFDEPFLSTDLMDNEIEAFKYFYTELKVKIPGIKILLTSYFEGLKENAAFILSLPINAIHLDLARAPEQLDYILERLPSERYLSMGLIDGRNVWKNDYLQSVGLIKEAIANIGKRRIMIAPSCSLMHVPYSLESETGLNPLIKESLSFAKEKLSEINDLVQIIDGRTDILSLNQQKIHSGEFLVLKTNKEVQRRILTSKNENFNRISPFSERQKIQKKKLKLPLFPTTTIGSFPQTSEIRKLRLSYKKTDISKEHYEQAICNEIEKVIKWQEETGIDVFVHGEFERNDMVEYFGEQLDGFTFTKNGWIQSYGSRCVKPPIIYGDVSRRKNMTSEWILYARSLTEKPVKGMLTGPITILQWSFVRNDQPRSETATQIAFAIRDEVADLENEGISIIQIDEPALREGLPVRKSDREEYLKWAIKAFKIASSGVKDETQIHTHMCYCEFNDIIQSIAELDADVITIETSRSQMELLDIFADFKYPNEIGPGVYDIHSPRVPSVNEIVDLLEKAIKVIPIKNIWVNPDCGLKTRKWEETEISLQNMIEAAKKMRLKVQENIEFKNA